MPTSIDLVRRARDQVVGVAKAASGAILGNLRLEYEGRSQQQRARMTRSLAVAASTRAAAEPSRREQRARIREQVRLERAEAARRAAADA